MDEDRLHVHMRGRRFPFDVIAFVDTMQLTTSSSDGIAGVKRIRILHSDGLDWHRGACNESIFAGHSLYLMSAASDYDWTIKWNHLEVRSKETNRANMANGSSSKDSLDISDMQEWPGDCKSWTSGYLKPCQGWYPASVTQVSLSHLCPQGEPQRLSLMGVAVSDTITEHVKLQVDIALPWSY